MLEFWHIVTNHVISIGRNKAIFKIKPYRKMKEIHSLVNNANNIRKYSHLAIAEHDIFFTSYTVWKLKNKCE